MRAQDNPQDRNDRSFVWGRKSLILPTGKIRKGYVCKRNPTRLVHGRGGSPLDKAIMNDSFAKNKSRPTKAILYLLPLAFAMGLDAGILLAPFIVDASTWTHVEFGETILQVGRLPNTTEVADGYGWVNDSYLSDVLMALVARVGGENALAGASGCLAVVIIVLLLSFNRRDNVSWMATIVAVLLVWSILVKQWRVGPQLASLCCFAAILALVQFAFEGWRGKWHWTSINRWTRTDWETGDDGLKYNSGQLRWLWLAVPIFCLWANLHNGFRIGLVIFWTYLACRALEAICQRGRLGWGLVRRMAMMGAVAGLATLVNPYGPWLHGWLSSAHTLAERTMIEGPAESIIGASGLWSVFLMVLAFALASQAVAFRRCDLAQVTSLAVAVALTIGDSRHACYFALATGFWMGVPLHEFWKLVESITLGRRQPMSAVTFQGISGVGSSGRFFGSANGISNTTAVDGNAILPPLPDESQVGNNSRSRNASKG